MGSRAGAQDRLTPPGRPYSSAMTQNGSADGEEWGPDTWRQDSCPSENCHGIIDEPDWQEITTEQGAPAKITQCSNCGQHAVQCVECAEVLSLAWGHEDHCELRHAAVLDRDGLFEGVSVEAAPA